ncbi:Thioredoxin-1 [Maioricimonas rarisocia]|uniref:Thioredoxin n=1 Tax=Maioricimonas rarisocia TaxID=2528026 RepID=A0A517Z9N6_9PLAN|nr:thioredoxin [Maioricimonas rarisocia]QDU39140.1 Thioredoxin-1 [Maioricimonas rarisocia]
MARNLTLIALLLFAAGCAGESLPPIDGNEVTVTEDSYQEEVAESSVPVLIDFWAPWCGPCVQMEPVIAHVSVNYEGRLKVAKVNVDENPRLASEFAINGIPAFVLVRDGEIVSRTEGSRSLASMSDWIDSRIAAAP